MNNLNMDNSINLDELKKSLDERRAVPVSSDGEETQTVGGDFASRLMGERPIKSNVERHDYIDSTITAHKALESFDPDNITAVPMSSVETIDESYVGPGLVVDDDNFTEDDREAPKYGVGLTPNVIDGLDAYMKEMDADIAAAKERVEELKAQHGEPDNDSKDNNDEESTDMTKDEFNRKYEEAIVVIDKTNFGRVINFTDEEHDKLEKVKKIKLEEVETVSLDTIKTKKPKKKDIEKIIKRVSNITTTNIVLPISGYTAEMKGCSAYELISLMDDNENALLNAQNKWSLIHSKIENTSIGNLDFTDFLLNTAANDYNTFIYGLLCSTYPDDDKLPLTCTKCKKTFDHPYSVKSLIRAEAMSERLQETFMNIVDSSVSEQTAKKAHDEALISQVKRVKLPNSGIIAEVYVQSAYDLINKSIKELTENNTDEKFAQTAVLATLINAFYVPDPDEPGTYFEMTSSMDISKTIYALNEVDVLIIRKIGDELMDDMSVSYGLMNIKCPHCGDYTPFIEMDLENILFQRYRQALNTVID